MIQNACIDGGVVMAVLTVHTVNYTET